MLNEKKKKLTNTIEAESTRLEVKRGKWDATVITELEDDIQRKKESLESINFLLSVEPTVAHNGNMIFFLKYKILHF